MRLALSLFGREVIAISTDSEAEWDEGSDLSGGDLGSTIIDAGPTDLYMGFGNGREIE